MITGTADVGVNVTLHVPELSVHELALNDPNPSVLNDTVPEGDEPVTVTVTVVGLLTLTVDGERVTVVADDNAFTVSVAVLELGALTESPP
jgi:xanthine dehydrogenase iron-sulfur cluster and FAD-binding subunit A